MTIYAFCLKKKFKSSFPSEPTLRDRGFVALCVKRLYESSIVHGHACALAKYAKNLQFLLI
jgi:hypothetical protein